MNSFNDVAAVWRGLLGKRLPSIRPGAEITIKEVGRDHVTVIGSRGERMRSFVELTRVYDALRQGEPIHVDSVLGGSGSSRNQPETLFANLPNVEWLVLDRRKHLVLWPDPTHDPGTLLAVEPIAAQKLRDQKTSPKPHADRVELIIPTDDPASVDGALTAVGAVKVASPASQEYHYALGPLAIRVVRESPNPNGIEPWYIALSGVHLGAHARDVRLGETVFRTSPLGTGIYLAEASRTPE